MPGEHWAPRNKKVREHLVDAIDRFWFDHGRAPSERELAKQLDMTPPTVHAHLTALIEEGRLAKDPLRTTI